MLRDNVHLHIMNTAFVYVISQILREIKEKVDE